MGKDVKIGIGVALSIGLLLFVFLVIRGGNEEKPALPTTPAGAPAAPSVSGTAPSPAGRQTPAPVTSARAPAAPSGGETWTKLEDIVELAPPTQERTAEVEIVGTPPKPSTPVATAPAGTKVEPPAPFVTTTPSTGGLTGGSPVVQVTAPAAAPQTYTTQKGDTLWSVAVHFYGEGRRWNKIYEANRDVLSSSSDVPVGAVLMIPPAEGESAAVEAQPPSTSQRAAAVAGMKTYTVEQRDTLYSIARKEYGDASLWRVIYEANRERIPDPDRLSVGAVIVIPPASEK